MCRVLDSADEDKNNFVRRKRLCYGCLGPGHEVMNCDRRLRPCSNCRRRHTELIPCDVSVASAFFTGGSSFCKPTYSRTCPVVLCHRSDPDKRVEGLAIIDEGSAVTLVNGNILSRLEIPEQKFSSSYLSVNTVDINMPTQSIRVIKGLNVARLSDPEARFEIKSCVEWKKLPCAVQEIPSPEEVAQFEELKHLTCQFPPVDPSWLTLMLIGRDCLWAMTHLQYIAPKAETPLAIQTPLDWTLVGPKPSLVGPKPLEKAGQLPFCASEEK